MPDFENLHRKNLALYLKQVDAIYNEAVKQASIIGRNVPNFNPDKPFYFADYPAVKKKIDKLLDTFHSRQFTAIVNGVDSEWTLANNKNNELCNSVFGKQTNLPKALAEKYYKNNHLAREAFKQRTVRGLNLSDRVWRYTNQFKQELEMSIEVALSSGKPANRLATDLKKYLQQPDKLFRRVRDKYGNLQLSKRAKSYHPGRGVYRSSYKNARRLAATETNIAYRTSDYERLQDLDFVVGIEIKLSNNHTLNGIPFTDICDTLMGKYPKDFKFTGWHPLCRCHSTTILKTEEEMSNDNEKILGGKEPQNQSVNKVRTAPNEFNTWVKDNKTRMENAKSLPYFLKDNRKYVNRANKVKNVKVPPNPLNEFRDQINSAASLSEVSTLLKSELARQGYDDVLINFPKTDIAIAKRYATELSSLCSDYTIEIPLRKFYTQQLSGAYGKVIPLNSSGTQTKYLSYIRGKGLNTGTKYDPRRLYDYADGKSLCDVDRAQVSTLVHEFGHMIWCGWEKSENALKFRTSMREIRADYHAEINQLARSKKMDDLKKVYLGSYASTNELEFVAEAFQEYKNKTNPSKYARLVGELMDKHFKKQ